MASYEFQSMLYRTEREMLDAIAGEWLSTGGNNDEQTQREYLADMTDDALAADCVAGWGLNEETDIGYGETKPSHMQQNGYEAYDLALAFGRVRKSMAA